MTFAIDSARTLPLADLRREGDAQIRTAAARNEPTFLTEDGQNVAVLVSPELYHSLLDAVDRLELLEALNAAEEQLAVGRTVPYSALRARLLKWASLPD